MNIITKYLFALEFVCVIVFCFFLNCLIDTHCLNVKITCLLINRDVCIGRFKHLYERLNFPCIILKPVYNIKTNQDTGICTKSFG